MYDLKIAIEERFDLLVEGFHESHGRAPSGPERTSLYDQAERAEREALASRADDRRKAELER